MNEMNGYGTPSFWVPLSTERPNTQLQTHPLDSAQFRLDWVKRRFAEMETVNRGYIDQEARFLRSSVRITLSPDSSIPDIRAPSKNGTLIPVAFPILVGEIAQHLRAILDYLVYRLAILDSGFEQLYTQFPVHDRPEDFQRSRKSRLKGINDAHAARIEKFQPYNGHDWTKRLVSISNRDKHMDLTVTLARSAVRLCPGTNPNPPTGSDHNGLSMVVEIPKEYDVIRQAYQVALGSPLYLEFFFALFVAFQDGKSVISTIEEIMAKVGDVLAEFKREF